MSQLKRGKGKESAGLLLYCQGTGGLVVLLVHPGGPFWVRRDHGAWSIPKGEIEEGEERQAAALRELREETGCAPDGPLLELGMVRQPGGKRIYAWAIETDWDPATLKCNSFEMEWPPRSGRRQSFPEVDRAAWFDLETARGKIIPGQAELLDRLAALLAEPGRQLSDR